MITHVWMIRDVWVFREFIWSAVKREFKTQWIGTQLGAFWIVAQPLATIIIFTVIFANIIRPIMPNYESRFAYSIYLCSGVLPFGLFTEILSKSVNIFVENANLLKKINFPRLCLPVIVILSGLINFAIIMALFIGFLLSISAFPGWVLVCMIPVLAIQLLFTIGLGMLLATINVFYRDIHKAVGVILQFWFWLTPIVYVREALPGFARKILQLNPLYYLVQAYQSIFLERTAPQWSPLIYPLILGIFFSVLGIYVFYKLRGEMVDAL
jgi:lipopolysaccharide transport system permease protein